MRTLTILLLGLAGPASAATYQVGPGKPHATLNALFSAVDLNAGDIVEVDGGMTYDSGTPGVVMPENDGGAPGNPVILRGVGASRPHLRGGVRVGGTQANTIEIRADHVVFENFEITGQGDITTGTFRCFFHHSHDVTIRNTYVHDCPRQGILGADTDSGSLTVEYSEVFNAGSNGGNHAIYMATDEVAHPGAVFRLQYSYLHDSDFPGGNGGNLIKSRAERNEIYYNWLEGAYFHELELIGPDPQGAANGWSDGLKREDSDVVGNVIVHTTSTGGNIIRIGGDGTEDAGGNPGFGESNGRYRFVNNTIIAISGAATPAVFRTHFGIEAVEMHNNVLFRDGANVMRVWREESPTEWVHGMARIHGSNNWIETGATFMPPGWTGTIQGASPGFTDIATLNLRPAAGSPLLNMGAQPPVSPPDYQFTNTLFPPVRHPPQRALIAVGTAEARTPNGVTDIGAFEQIDTGGIFANGFED